LATEICFSFNGFGFVTGNHMKIVDELGAAAANQIWWLNTNPSAGLLPHPN
jgi:hypothetical protein